MRILDDDVDDSAFYMDWDNYVPPKPPTFWTDARVSLLVELYGRGTHVPAIAKMLGCSKGAVVGKANRLGLIHPTKAA